MFYWFKRGNDLVQYEARGLSSTQYELTIVGPDGIERVERFDNSDDLHQRQVAFERELAAEGWVGPHGWNV
jgi:hypothetical protein